KDVNQIKYIVMMLFTVLMRVPLLFVGSFIMAVRTMPELLWMIILMVVLIVAIMEVVMGQFVPRFVKFQSLMDKMNIIYK
ncbi:ABC transporter ATP-binding protein, partial [Streptococcus suis]